MAEQGGPKRLRLAVEVAPRPQVETIEPGGAPVLVPPVSREVAFNAWLARQPVPWSAEAATKYGDDGFVPVAAFEMRGCELKSWSKAGTRAVVVTEGGTAFEDVELHEDWCEYDEENDASVQLLEVEFKVDTV